MQVTDPSDGRASRELYEGDASGGPLNGQHLVSRFPKGVVAVDKQNSKAWIYDFVAGDPTAPGRFVVRDEAGVSLEDEKRWAAAEGADYDVVVAVA